jgi:hypothetical protein
MYPWYQHGCWFTQGANQHHMISQAKMAMKIDKYIGHHNVDIDWCAKCVPPTL